MGSVYNRHSSLEQKSYGYTQEWFFILLLFHCCDLTILFIKQDILILEKGSLPSNDRTYGLYKLRFLDEHHCRAEIC